MLRVADAGLLIGDKGMAADGTGLNVLDLGASLAAPDRLPFVYAVWLGKAENLTPHLIQSLNAAKEWGQTQIDVIAQEQAQMLSLSRRNVPALPDGRDGLRSG